MTVRRERQLADNAAWQNAAAFEQPFFRVMKKLHVLETENDLRQHTLENFESAQIVTTLSALEDECEEIGNPQSGHHAANAGRNEVQHVHTAPSLEHADVSLGCLQYCRHFGGHHWFFEFDPAEMPMSAVQIRDKTRRDRRSGGIEIL